jgi:hypothetical protein
MNPVTPRYRSALTCGHSGRHIGTVEWTGERPAARMVLRPTVRNLFPLPVGRRICCPHCGGPAFAELPERVRESALPASRRAAVSRNPLPRAS